MAGVPSIGDILMLSQLAWKIGRSFTSGRRGAPADFLHVESEVNRLAKALKLLAEALFADSTDSLVGRADRETRDAVATILLSAQHTLQHLETLIEQYQVIKKHRTAGGFSIERSWSDLVLANYRKMMWTNQGGGIDALKNMLKMHTTTLTLTMEALQSNSLERLQNTVLPMAEEIDKIHGQVAGDTNKKLEQVYGVVMQIAGSTPDVPQQARSNQPSGATTPLWPDSPAIDPVPEPLRIEKKIPPERTPRLSPELKPYEASSWTREPESRRRDSMPLTSRRESDFSINPSFSDKSEYRSSISSSRLSPTSGRRHSRWSNSDLPAVRDADESESTRPSFAVSSVSSASPVLPSPIISPDAEPSLDVAEPMSRVSLQSSTSDKEKAVMERSTTTASQREEFERAAFMNSAILCDLRGTVVEYLKPADDESKHLEAELTEAMQDCRICIVRKRDTRPDGSVRFVTSIWALSDDHSVRLQQKLPENPPTPYPSYFNPLKISLPSPTRLKLHSPHHPSSPPLATPTTTWTSYTLSTSPDANAFQSEILGATVLGSFRTARTLRLHEGLAGVLAYQEQVAGMEVLRVVREEEGGRVGCLVHFSPGWAGKGGWLRWWCCGGSDGGDARAVRWKNEGGREVKVRGLRVVVDDDAEEGGRGRAASVGGSTAASPSPASTSTSHSHRSPSDTQISTSNSTSTSTSTSRPKPKSKPKIITGVRIEFATEGEKVAFLEVMRDAQRDPI